MLLRLAPPPNWLDFDVIYVPVYLMRVGTNYYKECLGPNNMHADTSGPARQSLPACSLLLPRTSQLISKMFLILHYETNFAELNRRMARP